jgi:enoyl-CoA hydratase/carnithine racemase
MLVFAKEEPTMTYEHILVEHDAPVATIVMNRPDRRNALSVAMMQELIDAFKMLGRDKTVRAVILGANGPAFSAGHDLRELVGGDINAYRYVFDVCTELMTTIQAIPQPVIARVQRIATAAGCQLVATCDLAVAAEEARFATPGVKIGLFCTTPMVALSRAIGRKRALQMLLTGELVPAQMAAEWGLVNQVVHADQLESATRDLALAIANASPLTVALGKQAFYTQIDLDQPKAYAYAKEVMSMNAMALDAQEGMCAFLEKRVPAWTGN